MKEIVTKKGTVLPIQQLKGKDYLMVAYRLVWFREECPHHSIETEFVQLTESYAIAKATIKLDSTVLATAHKREDKAHFADFMEKAETGAIGRALALCGYGTQFASEELDEGPRIVDGPASTLKQASAAKESAQDPEALKTLYNALAAFKWPKERYLYLCQSHFSVENPKNLNLDQLVEFVEICQTIFNEENQ